MRNPLRLLILGLLPFLCLRSTGNTFHTVLTTNQLLVTSAAGPKPSGTETKYAVGATEVWGSSWVVGNTSTTGKYLYAKFAALNGGNASPSGSTPVSHTFVAADKDTGGYLLDQDNKRISDWRGRTWKITATRVDVYIFTWFAGYKVTYKLE